MKTITKKRATRKNTIKKTIETLVITVCLLMLIWVFLSWIDVSSHNLDPSPQYHPFNAFMILF